MSADTPNKTKRSATRKKDFLTASGVYEGFNTTDVHKSYFQVKQIQLKTWLDAFNYNPVTALLRSNNEEIQAFTKLDLLDEPLSLEDLWQLSRPKRILQKQQPGGFWKYPAQKNRARLQLDYDQYQTFRNLSVLVEMYGLNKKHPGIARTAKYFFTVQSQQGDFRGIYGTQYSPNYAAAIAELLIKAGYHNDAHIQKFFSWILDIRQDDGGWALPFRTKGCLLDAINDHSKTMQPDTSKPFSHMVTGVVLRAFAAHPKYRKSKEASEAGKLLLSSLFKKDNYPDRSGPEYWLRFSFPFDYTHLISALDSLSLLGFLRSEPQIQESLKWIVEKQQKNGFWKFRLVRGSKKDALDYWLTLAVCRIFKRFYS